MESYISAANVHGVKKRQLFIQFFVKMFAGEKGNPVEMMFACEWHHIKKVRWHTFFSTGEVSLDSTWAPKLSSWRESCKGGVWQLHTLFKTFLNRASTQCDDTLADPKRELLILKSTQMSSRVPAAMQQRKYKKKEDKLISVPNCGTRDCEPTGISRTTTLEMEKFGVQPVAEFARFVESSDQVTNWDAGLCGGDAEDPLTSPETGTCFFLSQHEQRTWWIFYCIATGALLSRTGCSLIECA